MTEAEEREMARMRSLVGELLVRVSALESIATHQQAMTLNVAILASTTEPEKRAEIYRHVRELSDQITSDRKLRHGLGLPLGDG